MRRSLLLLTSALCALSGTVLDALITAPLAKAEVHLEPATARLQAV